MNKALILLFYCYALFFISLFSSLPLPLCIALNELEKTIEKKDQYGNCKYKFENGKIVENITPPTESQIELRNFRKTDLLNIIRILLKGIQDNSDKDFLDFVAKIGKINE